MRLYACLLACDHMPYVAPLTELFWLLADVKLVLCVTKPNDKLVSQCAARSGSPRYNKIITLVGASLNELHTSVTSLRMHIRVYVCLLAWTDH